MLAHNHCHPTGHSKGVKSIQTSPCVGLCHLLWIVFLDYTGISVPAYKLIAPPSVTLIDGKRARTEAPMKCPLADTHMNSSEKLQFYKEKAPECHGPLLKCEAVSSQEAKKNKKRAFEEPEKEQSSSSQSSKQKYVCLTVEDWDLLNSY